MKKVKMAFLGAGPRGSGLMNYEYSKHPQLEIVAVCDRAEGYAESSAAVFKETARTELKVFKSYEDMIKNASFDALMIASDPDLQVEYAVDAMDRGIHVMTEVPAAHTIKQCHALVEAVEKNGVKYQLAEQTRYWYFIKQFREMAERGEFGKIIYAEGQYYHYEPAWDSFMDIKTGRRIVSSDPMLFLDPNITLSWRGRYWRNPIKYLPHELSPLLSITGGRISKVSCFGTRPLDYATETMPARDIQHAIMYNEDDVLFSLRAIFYSPTANGHWYQVKGTKASVELPRSDLDTGKLYRHGEGWSEFPIQFEDPNAPEHIKNSSHGGADFYPIDAFINAIINDTQPPLDVYKAVETAAPAILAAESCEKGGVMLEVPDFRKKTK